MKLSTLLGDIASEADSAHSAEEFRIRLFQHVRRIAPYDSAIFLPTGPTPATLIKKQYNFSHLYRERREIFDRDQDKGRRAAALNGGAYIDLDVYSSHERRNLPFFAEIVRPQGITSRIVGGLRLRGSIAGSVHLSRHGRTRRFSARELSGMLAVLPLASVAHEMIALKARLSRVHTELADPQLDEFRDRLERLTPRERAVADHLAQGFTNPQIALLLGTSVNTVRKQTVAIFLKTHVEHRARFAGLMKLAALRV